MKSVPFAIEKQEKDIYLYVYNYNHYIYVSYLQYVHLHTFVYRSSFTGELKIFHWVR